MKRGNMSMAYVVNLQCNVYLRKVNICEGLGISLKDYPSRPQYSCVELFRDVSLRICLC